MRIVFADDATFCCVSDTGTANGILESVLERVNAEKPSVSSFYLYVFLNICMQVILCCNLSHV